MSETALSINTQSKEELSAIVQQMNPELEYLLDLHPKATTCRTLLVKMDGVECALKVRNISRNIWDDTYFYLEIHALRRVAERKITGVTELLGEYKNDRFHAILKSFAVGTPCNKLDLDELLHNSEFVKKLDALYLKLHLAGIAKINFLPRKIVISDDGELTLVDLSSCIINTESGIQLFSREMRIDSRFITRLERNTTHYRTAWIPSAAPRRPCRTAHSTRPDRNERHCRPRASPPAAAPFRAR